MAEVKVAQGTAWWWRSALSPTHFSFYRDFSCGSVLWKHFFVKTASS